MGPAVDTTSVREEPFEPVLAMRLLGQMSRVRIVIVFVLLHGLLAASAGPIFSRAAAYGGVSIAALLAIASYFVFDWRREFGRGRLDMAAAVFMVADVMALSFFIYGMGGIYSYFFPLLLCEVVFAAFFFHGLEIVFVVGIVCCSLTLAAFSQHLSPTSLTQAGIAVTGVIVLAWLAHGLGLVMQRERIFNQRVIRHLGQPVCLLASSGRLLLINPQLEQLAGTTASRVVGKHLSEVRADEDAGLLPVLLANLEALLVHEDADGQDIEVKNPEPVTLRRSVVPCPSPTGAPVGWVVLWQDITDLVESVKAQEMGLSLVSHEMRSPITCLRLLIDVLSNITDTDGEQRERVITHLMEETDRLSRLVASVLDLAQFDNPDFQMELSDLEPLGLVRRVGSLFVLRGAEAKVNFTCECPDALPGIQAHEDRLEQVLINLCENAINHTPEGGQVSLHARSTPTALILEVRDTGLGIPDNIKEHIFDKFYSGGTVISGPGRLRVSGGLGLGLALTKRIVELHGGTIAVGSRPGGGTTFTVTLPADRRRTTASDEAIAASVLARRAAAAVTL